MPMNISEFIQSQEVQRALLRAGRAAGMPLSIHPIGKDGEEGSRICGSTTCSACSYVAGLPSGRSACRASRTGASNQALHQNRPIPFICHMGFACVSLAMPVPASNLVITIGPWNPSDTSDNLEYDACRGLQQLTGVLANTFPVSLTDIRVVPTSAIIALAEWLSATLHELWETNIDKVSSETEQSIETNPETATTTVEVKNRSNRNRIPQASLDTNRAREISAALIAGNKTQAGTLFEGALLEYKNQASVRQAEMIRMRAMTITSAVVESIAAAGVPAPSLDKFADWVKSLQKENDLESCKKSALQFLSKAITVKRNQQSENIKQSSSPQAEKLRKVLNTVLKHQKLDSEITLQQVADILGETPSAISHRMKKLLGMHFSEYLGRVRIEEAKRLLRSTKLSATIIAQRVGIADQSNFGKLFKKYAGMTPIEYRKRIQNLL